MIKKNAQSILKELPIGVELVAACKTRTPEEIMEAIEAGVKIIGENYVQEAEKAFDKIGKKARWHFIGHLQKNKVKKAIRIFDVIETVHSLSLAEEIDRVSLMENKMTQVLIEINSGKEKQKFGVLPEKAETLIMNIARLRNIKVMGLMTMGPVTIDPEETRPCFTETRKLFDKIAALNIHNIYMQYLSMGMSNSYKVAIEEGANIVRIGTGIFGQR